VKKKKKKRGRKSATHEFRTTHLHMLTGLRSRGGEKNSKKKGGKRVTTWRVRVVSKPENYGGEKRKRTGGGGHMPFTSKIESFLIVRGRSTKEKEKRGQD